MTVIVFANPKGGAGKTTCALVLATQLSESGATVTVVDADPERWISAWANLPGKPDNITIVNDVAEDSVMDRIEAATRESQFVIVDCEGTASLMVANAVGMADLVLVPTQGSSMDARGCRQDHPADREPGSTGTPGDPAPRRALPDERSSCVAIAEKRA